MGVKKQEGDIKELVNSFTEIFSNKYKRKRDC